MGWSSQVVPKRESKISYHFKRVNLTVGNTSHLVDCAECAFTCRNNWTIGRQSYLICWELRNFSWVLSLISVLPCVGALVKLCQFKQVNMPKEGCYVAPFVPILPAIGIYFNLVLAWNTKNVTWFHLILYTSVGLVIYFVYGIQNSKVGRTWV